MVEQILVKGEGKRERESERRKRKRGVHQNSQMYVVNVL